MDILGIGPTEFIFVIIILLLVLGPRDLAALGRKSGQWIRKARQSETWRLISDLSRSVRNLPAVLADETKAEEIFSEVVNGPRSSVSKRVDDLKRGAPPAVPGQIEPPGANRYSAWTTPAEQGEGEEVPSEQEDSSEGVGASSPSAPVEESDTSTNS